MKLSHGKEILLRARWRALRGVFPGAKLDYHRQQMRCFHFLRGFLRGAPLAMLVAAGVAAAQPQPYGLDSRADSPPYLTMPTSETNVPTLLSQTGVFDFAGSTFTPKPALVPYGLNSPFWSDGAVKTRWIALPFNNAVQDNPTIGFTPSEWTFPDGTVFVKHFELVINEKTGLTRRLETRVLVRKAGGYVYGRSYRWKPDGTDADVVADDTNSTETIMITQADGVTTRTQVWTYPKPDQCTQCHTTATGGVLGLKTRQQNGDLLYPTGIPDNQLRTLGNLGMFGSGFNETAIPTYQKLVSVSDMSATLINRVRSYLDSNCSQCHRPGGPGGEYDARYDTPIASQMIFGDGAHGFSKLVRFNPGASGIIQRDSKTSGQGGMPPLDKNVVDTFWIDTVTAFVNYSYDVTAVAASTLVPTQVRVTFDRYVDPVSATTIANYAIDNGILVQGATLLGDGKTVSLTTTAAMAGGTLYTLLVNNVKEQQPPKNPVFPDTLRTFQLNDDEDGDGIPNGVETVEGRNPIAKDNDVFSPGAAAARLFVMQQYRDFLAREGDAAGIQGWVDYIQAGTYSRLQVIDAFLSSNEFSGFVAPVVRLYFATYLRVPDYAGLTFNAGLVRNGTVTLTQLADFFTQSPEFLATYGSLNNTQFVTLLYNNVLGRAPDQAGLDGWVGLLQGGYTRGQVLLGFSDSTEYQASIGNEVFVTMMYTGMLRRTPEPAGFSGWVNGMDMGTYARTQVINGFFLSTEYYHRFLP
jgi:Domain of unknown function (DUF4214)